MQTSLHVHFRTSSQAGLLFLAVGSRDFLLLELISGHMQVRLPLFFSGNCHCLERNSFLSFIHLGGAWCQIADGQKRPLAFAPFQNKFLHDSEV